MPECLKGCGKTARIKGFCNSHYQARRTKHLRAGIWQRPIASIGVTRRLRGLVAIGYSQGDLCRHSGLSPSTISHLIRGSVEATSTANAAKVLALYDLLSMTPGPSDYHRCRAKAAGWAPPLAWDDDTIDSPDARPDFGERRPTNWGERFLELRDLGYTDVEIMGRFKIHPESMSRQMIRYGIPMSAEMANLAASQKHHRKAAAS